MKNSRPLDRCGYTVVTVNPSPAQCNEANIEPFIDCSDRVIEDFLVSLIQLKLNCTVVRIGCLQNNQVVSLLG